METTKKKSRKTAAKSSREKIMSAYIDQVLDTGKQPASVYKFCQEIGMKEEDFYDFFGSFEGIEKQVWKEFADHTISRLQADEAFDGFTTREKVLAFYYTLLEELKSKRSFVVLQLGAIRKFEGLTPGYLKEFKVSVETFFESLLSDGKTSGEVANRPYLDKRYPQLFWLHLGFILLFWKDDESPGFEKTDAAVEKSVNLAFDLIGKGAVDTAIDFGKFLYQNKIR